MCHDHSSKTGLLFSHLNKTGDLVHGLVERRVCDPCYTELNNEVYEAQDFIESMKERGAVIKISGANSKFGRNGFFKKQGSKVSDKWCGWVPSTLRL